MFAPVTSSHKSFVSTAELMLYPPKRSELRNWTWRDVVEERQGLHRALALRAKSSTVSTTEIYAALAKAVDPCASMP